jgi:RHS repeat-associated protein
MESSNSGYHGSLSGQTGPNIQTYTMAFSDRTHGFLGGFNAVGAPGFARTVLDDAGLQSQRMWYDRLGRLVFSQNTKQQLAGNYSYSTYDALGRVAEAGQVSASTANPFSMVLGANVNGAFNPTVINDANAVNFLYYNLRTEVLTTHYDQSMPGNTVPFTQENLRLRVASVTYQDAMDNNAGTPTVDGDPLTFQHATHYSYDIHGNVKHLAQDIPQLNLAAGLPNPYTGPHRYKELHYTFDLISGNVNEVTYQPGKLEQWIHKYTYDADNRLSQASFTSNNADIELGANYLYYPHGPLRRLELGHKGIQGMDYAYTLQGWIKGLNSDILKLTNDMGGDSRAGSLNATFPRDVFGYSLHYNLNDYKAIDPDWGNSTVTDFLAKRGGDIDNSTNLRELYNGNIASWSQTLPNTNMWGPTSANEIGNNLRFVYQYDQLNRLLVARASDKMNAGNDWSAITANLPTQLYKSSYGYDANGNILNAERWDQFQTRYDQFEYNYLTSGGKRRSNRLYRVKDQMPANVVDPSDPADQGVADIDDNGLLFNNDPVTINNGSNNYRYDPLGNLNQDKREQIAQIDWTVAGKVKSVTRTAGSTLAALTFGYGAHGHRIWKKNLQTGNTTFYIHDAQGNLMATYEAKPAVNSLALSERPIYGSDRLGMDVNKIELYGLPDIRFTNLPTNGPAGLRRYEIKDHLGNVCVTTTGDRYGIDQTPPDGTIDYTMPKVVSWSGYEPFGSLLPGRQFNAGNYRFGFQGQEKDDEVYGATGTSNTAEFWQYDTRLGRRWNLDPVIKGNVSSYSCFSNAPTMMVDPLGDTDYYNRRGKWIGTDGIDNGVMQMAIQTSTAKVIRQATRKNEVITMNPTVYTDIVQLPNPVTLLVMETLWKLSRDIEYTMAVGKQGGRELWLTRAGMEGKAPTEEALETQASWGRINGYSVHTHHPDVTQNGVDEQSGNPIWSVSASYPSLVDVQNAATYEALYPDFNQDGRQSMVIGPEYVFAEGGSKSAPPQFAGVSISFYTSKNTTPTRLGVPLEQTSSMVPNAKMEFNAFLKAARRAGKDQETRRK